MFQLLEVVSCGNKTQVGDNLSFECGALRGNPFKPEFTIVIFIFYKPRIAVAILDL